MITIYVKLSDSAYSHVDGVDHEEADDLPELDLLVEEHEDEIHRGHLRLRRILSITM